MFQANTNAFLKNLETQVGQLTLSMLNQSKDAFLNDTKKNLKDCMVVTLRSGRELKSRKEEEMRNTEKDEQEETEREDKLSSSELVKETKKEEVQIEKKIEKGKLKKKEEMQTYCRAPIPAPARRPNWIRGREPVLLYIHFRIL